MVLKGTRDVTKLQQWYVEDLHHFVECHQIQEFLMIQGVRDIKSCEKISILNSFQIAWPPPSRSYDRKPEVLTSSE